MSRLILDHHEAKRGAVFDLNCHHAMSRQNIIESFVTAMPADATNAHVLVHPDSAWCQSGRVVHEQFGMGWLAYYTKAGGDDFILCGDGAIDRFKPNFRD